jgi:hypothetical protein
MTKTVRFVELMIRVYGKQRITVLDYDPSAYSLEIFRPDRSDEVSIYIPLK